MLSIQQIKKYKRRAKAKSWFHYTKGLKCSKCGVPVVNASKSICRICNLTKEKPKDLGSQRYRKRNPGKIKARKAVSYAIKSGRLVRGKCIVCGEPNAEAHHVDYRKPLEIMWFCRKHHFEHEHENTR